MNAGGQIYFINCTSAGVGLWDRLVDWEFIVYTSCILFYMFVMGMLFTAKDSVFRSEYFLLLKISGTFDIVYSIIHEINRAEYRVGLGPSVVRMIATIICFCNVTQLLHITLRLLMTIHQYTAILHSDIHRDIWKRNRVFAVSVVLLLCGIGIYCPQIFFQQKYYQLDGVCQRMSVDMSTPDKAYIFQITVSILCVNMVANAFMNLRIFFALLRIQKTNYQLSQQHWPLFALAMVNFVFIFLVTLNFLNEIEITPWFHRFFMATLDSWTFIYFALLYYHQPFALIILSTAAREEIFRWFLNKDKKIFVVSRSQ